MKTKIFLVLALFTLYGFRIWQTSGCKSINSFHINPLTVKIAVESQRLIDDNASGLTSKFFHNKITTGIFENSKNLFSVFNPNLILTLIGPAGIFSIVYLFANFTKIKSNFFHLHLIYIFSSAVLMTLINPKTALFNFALSLFSFSFWIIKFTGKKPVLSIFLLILIIFSFWYYSLDWQMKTICNEIFFS